VAGFSLIFIALGTSVGAMGEFIGQNTDVLLKISGGLIIAFGVFLLISPKIPWLNYEKRLSLPITGAGYFRSLSMGMVFSLAWTPCVGPVLGSILTLALSSQEAWQGTYLLTLYSLGLGIPFILLGGLILSGEFSHLNF
jgi:cytochrome c-type biogenesis protein